MTFNKEKFSKLIKFAKNNLKKFKNKNEIKLYNKTILNKAKELGLTKKDLKQLLRSSCSFILRSVLLLLGVGCNLQLLSRQKKYCLDC